MSKNWNDLLTERRVAREPSSRQELDEIRAMIATNLKDANVPGLSAQGRYEFAYNAARLLGTLVVRAAGYRVIAKNGHHYFTFRGLEAADKAFVKTAAYFDSARTKRNDFSYDAPIDVAESEALELIDTFEKFLQRVEAWIRARDPSLG
jgi:hypothetical protein